MSAWIRWPGLIAFAVIMLIVILGFYFFAGPLARHAIEYNGTEMLGAKVDLASAEMQLSPLGFELRDLQITHPDKPMSNALQIERITFQMDLWALLAGQVDIRDMSLQAVRLNTPRRVSGALPKAKAQPKKDSKPATPAPAEQALPKPSINLPKVKDILAKETLQTETLYEQTQSAFEQNKQQWQQRVAKLAKRDDFKQLAQRLKNIKPKKSGDRLQDIKNLNDAVEEVKRIKKQVRGDLKQYQESLTQLRSYVKDSEKSIRALRQSASGDLTRLKTKYTPKSENLANYSALLFGEKGEYWTKEALYWYQLLEPYLEKATKEYEKSQQQDIQTQRANGTMVRFKTFQPRPDFLIRKASFDLRRPNGEWQGELKDASSDQRVWARPMRVSLQADKQANLEQLRINAVFDHTKPDQSNDKFELTVGAYQLKDFSVSESKDLPLSLKSARVDLNMNGVLINKRLDAKLNSNFTSAQFFIEKQKGENDFSKLIRQSLENINTFDINSQISGKLSHPKLSISSDLDKLLKKAIGEQFQKQLRAFETELKKSLQDKADALMAKLTPYTQQFNAVEKDLNTTQNDAQNTLKAAENKLQSYQQQLEEKKREKQQELDKKRKALDDKKQDKLDELKNKLKDKFKF